MKSVTPADHELGADVDPELLLARRQGSRAGDELREPVRADGLHHPASISRRPDGTVHIVAADEHDGWFAQGFAHAQLRLWQMELQRRVGSVSKGRRAGAYSVKLY